MRAYIGFDDTDILGAEIGTGKLVRRYEALLPAGCRLWGVVRQQLLVDPRIPYTSHNSSACAVVDFDDPSLRDELIERAVGAHRKGILRGQRSRASAWPAKATTPCKNLASLGLACTARIVTQEEARRAAEGIHLSGHGGTRDGIIGAAAAVGLTAEGWSGRFIEFNDLRDIPEQVSVGELAGGVSGSYRWIGMRSYPRKRIRSRPGGGCARASGGHAAVLPVRKRGEHLWENIAEKRKKPNEKKGREKT